ncbi:RDD family protein [Halobacillus locisalis]|uniref:RDD family protein n=1 Tax=Halobacillus locisalis TaxID=220753 RepID=A0A838CVS9_9BACI|nr:RDD family protein [Halobacillus locisalis]MBA2176023.1 RDD family protein [Halobacillus locisalis]
MELFLDWLFISVYLLLLLSITVLFYQLAFDGIPEFSSAQSQWVATLTSVVPLVLLFSIMEGREPYASWGKRKTGLKVFYKGSPVKGSLIRNVLKFFLWQLGHMSTIQGIYEGYDNLFAILCLTLSVGLSLTYIVMVLIRKDQRHLADLIAGSGVDHR